MLVGTCAAGAVRAACSSGSESRWRLGRERVAGARVMEGGRLESEGVRQVEVVLTEGAGRPEVMASARMNELFERR